MPTLEQPLRQEAIRRRLPGERRTATIPKQIQTSLWKLPVPSETKYGLIGARGKRAANSKGCVSALCPASPQYNVT